MLYDLDLEARLLCDELGLSMVRARTVGTHPRFVSLLRELITERIDMLPESDAGPSVRTGPAMMSAPSCVAFLDSGSFSTDGAPSRGTVPGSSRTSSILIFAPSLRERRGSYRGQYEGIVECRGSRPAAIDRC